jgi:hypothetical protein
VEKFAGCRTSEGVPARSLPWATHQPAPTKPSTSCDRTLPGPAILVTQVLATNLGGEGMARAAAVGWE